MSSSPNEGKVIYRKKFSTTGAPAHCPGLGCQPEFIPVVVVADFRQRPDPNGRHLMFSDNSATTANVVKDGRPQRHAHGATGLIH